MKVLITESQYNSILKENDDIWYHGTPDARGIEKTGFVDKKYTVNYIKDFDTYMDLQKTMEKARESGQEDLYHKALDSIPKTKGTLTLNKPIFLSNVYKVANTYAQDKPAYDYQNSIPKVFKVKTNVNNTLKIPAYGLSFRGIPVETLKKSLSDAGVSQEDIEKQLQMFHLEIRRNGKISSMSMSAIAQILGFDSIDVIGVLDSYNVGITKSTVRIIFNPKNIAIIK